LGQRDVVAKLVATTFGSPTYQYQVGLEAELDRVAEKVGEKKANGGRRARRYLSQTQPV
jgi:hypothetical protein